MWQSKALIFSSQAYNPPFFFARTLPLNVVFHYTIFNKTDSLHYEKIHLNCQYFCIPKFFLRYLAFFPVKCMQ